MPTAWWSWNGEFDYPFPFFVSLDQEWEFIVYWRQSWKKKWEILEKLLVRYFGPFFWLNKWFLKIKSSLMINDESLDHGRVASNNHSFILPVFLLTLPHLQTCSVFTFVKCYLGKQFLTYFSVLSSCFIHMICLSLCPILDKWHWSNQSFKTRKTCCSFHSWSNPRNNRGWTCC